MKLKRVEFVNISKVGDLFHYEYAFLGKSLFKKNYYGNSMQEFKKFCSLLAEESGNIIRGYFRSDINIETKADESPVTIADKKAEEKMRELIMKNYPGHGILGEEFGIHNEGAALWQAPCYLHNQ